MRCGRAGCGAFAARIGAALPARAGRERIEPHDAADPRPCARRSRAMPLFRSASATAVAARGQRRLERHQRRAALELGRRTGLRAEVAEVDRRLRVEVPVVVADHPLRHVLDDRGAARRADHGVEVAERIEHDDGRHRAPRALARLDPVRDRRAVHAGRREREVGELVVEQEAAHHAMAAERAFDRRGHGHRIAFVVDDRDVRRPSGIGVHAVRERDPPAAAGRRARRRHAHRARRVDRLAPLGQIGGIEQAGDGHRHEGVVGHVAVAIRVGKPLRLGDQVDRVRARDARSRADRRARPAPVSSASSPCRTTACPCRRSSCRGSGRTAALASPPGSDARSDSRERARIRRMAAHRARRCPARSRRGRRRPRHLPRRPSASRRARDFASACPPALGLPSGR